MYYVLMQWRKTPLIIRDTKHFFCASVTDEVGTVGIRADKMVNENLLIKVYVKMKIVKF